MYYHLFTQAAYRHNTLGLPKLCPPESIEAIDRSTLYTYLHNYHSPDRMVLAGVGVEHQTLVDLAKKYFCTDKPIWQQEPSIIDPTKGKDLSLSQYTGGIIQVSVCLY